MKESNYVHKSNASKVPLLETKQVLKSIIKSDKVDDNYRTNWTTKVNKMSKSIEKTVDT